MTQPDFVRYAAAVPDVRDADHLRVLGIVHHVWGGMTVAFSCLFIVHVVMGALIVTGRFPQPANAPPGQNMPAVAGYLFMGIGSCAVVMGWTLGVLTIVTGRRIVRRRSRGFCLVVAAINCISFPLGTTLGVFTILVLARESVKTVFAANGAGPGAGSDRRTALWRDRFPLA